MMHCPKCNAEVLEQAVYCHKCGERIDAEDQEFAPPPSAAAESSDSSPATDEEKDYRPSKSQSGNGGADRLKELAAERQSAAEEDEKDLWQGGFSNKGMIGAWALSALITVLLVVATIYMWNISWLRWILLVAVPVLWVCQFARLWYRKLNVRYWLTTQRFIHEDGIFRRVTNRIEIIDIDDIAFEQGLLERLVGVGTICIESSDRSHPELLMPGIENVKEVAGIFDDARRAERRRRGLHIESI